MTELRKKILSEIDGKTLNYCFSCGVCTGSCPSARVSGSRFNPRKAIHRAVIEESIGEETWLCTNCYVCQERCPTKTRVGDLMSLMRRIMVEEKGIPSFIKPLVDNLGSCGFTANIGELENKRRERMGLPAVKSNLEVRKIIELTGGGL